MVDHCPAVEVVNLRKEYISSPNVKKEALKNITLTIPQGSFFGLLGPNGAGKSTLINILAGITIKTEGAVKINGWDIDQHPRASRFSIGVVPQEIVLDPFFTVRETLENYAGYYGISAAKRRTSEIIEALGLTDKADIKPRSLSGGMKRRLLIAKALVHSPPVLVLDEPTAGVDVELRQQLWNYVKELNRKGTTILLTTHYLEEAEELCDHIAIINHGTIIACDSKKRLMHLLDHKQIILTLSEPITDIPTALQAFHPQLNREGQLILNYKSNEIAIETILLTLTQTGLSIKDLSTKEADLEDIFRHLIAQR